MGMLMSDEIRIPGADLPSTVAALRELANRLECQQLGIARGKITITEATVFHPSQDHHARNGFRFNADFLIFLKD